MSQMQSTRRASALELFRLGWGSDRIAKYWKISEADALRQINVERAASLRLPVPYRRNNG